MSPQTQDFLTKLAEVNTVLKALTGSSEANVLSATIPGVAQIVADIKIGEDVINMITTVVPILDTFNIAWSVGGDSTEAIDQIYETRAVGDGA